MAKCRMRLETAFGIPDQTLGDEVYEEIVITAQHLLKSLGARSSPSAFGVHHRSRGASLVCENVSRGRLHYTDDHTYQRITSFVSYD